MRRLYGMVVARAERLIAGRDPLWRGFRVVAVDKVSLQLPESPSLFRKFGCHKGNDRLGTIQVEAAVLFTCFGRIPKAFAFNRAYSSEATLLRSLLKRLKPRDLLLIDNGFYSLPNFKALLERGCHFLCPAAISGRPTVDQKLGDGDYLCTIYSLGAKAQRLAKADRMTMTVRVIFAYRDGFRRRRIVTSLLDPEAYPAAAIVELYHHRWHVETFYRDLKSTMAGNCWHCKSPEAFEKEFCAKLIVVCLLRTAAAEAAARRGVEPGRVSFTRALTEVRRLYQRVSQGACASEWEAAYGQLVEECSRYLIRVKPGRFYPRSKQAYRRKARGLERKKRGRPRTKEYRTIPVPPEVDTRIDGTKYLNG